MKNIKDKLVAELKKLLPVTLYFLFAGELIALTSHVVLSEYQIDAFGYLTALLIALVIAKVVIIIDLLPIMNIFKHKPAIWNTTWGAVLYFLGSLCFQLVESTAGPLFSGVGLSAALDAAAAEIPWPRFWIKQLWIFALLFNYCLVRELGVAVGRGTFSRVLFRDRNAAR